MALSTCPEDAFYSIIIKQTELEARQTPEWSLKEVKVLKGQAD